MLLGVHCDIRKGYIPALRLAESLGCQAMQILSYRRHCVPTQEELADFKRHLEESRVSHLVVHVRYLPYLASEDAAKRDRSVELLAWEMSLAEALGAKALIAHLGAYSPESSLARGLKLFAQGVQAARQASGSAVRLLLENVPGGGRRMGGSLEELASALDLVRRREPEAGACLDTAHAWAAGYEISSAEGMEAFLTRARRLLGNGGFPVFHLNDTASALGSSREHHAHWGEGVLGMEGLAALLAKKECEADVGILEAPPGPVYAEELRRLRALGLEDS